MKKKILLMLSLIAIMTALFTISVSAAYYCDKDGNLVEAGSENIAYEFDVGGDRNIDGNKCFRVSAVYLHDTSLTKIVFPVASQIKNGYAGIAPQSGWNASLGVYSVNENGERNTEVSYATQITEVEFLSGVDFDGASGKGTFAGFTGLQKLVFNGNVSMGNDATNKGGMFSNAPITNIEIKGSGNVNLVITRHISTSNNLTVTFDKDCTAHVYVVRGSRHCLPSASIPNWTFIFNPNLTYGVYSSSLTVTPLCEKGTPTTKIIVGVDTLNGSTDEATAHNLLYSNENQTVIEAELKAWCELGQDEHNSSVQWKYDNGFDNAGEKIEGCSKCNNGTTEQLPALFYCLGYSAPENSVGGIAIAFTVNKEAVTAYTEATGKALKYGVFAVSQEKLGDNDIFDDDGVAADGVINAEIKNVDFVAFELKIVGFTETQKDAKLALGAYVAVTDGEATEYSYMQNGEPNENEKYCFASYNEIIDIAGKPSMAA